MVFLSFFPTLVLIKVSMFGKHVNLKSCVCRGYKRRIQKKQLKRVLKYEGLCIQEAIILIRVARIR